MLAFRLLNLASCLAQGSAVGEPAFSVSDIQAELENAIKRYTIVDLN